MREPIFEVCETNCIHLTLETCNIAISDLAVDESAETLYEKGVPEISETPETIGAART